MLLVAALSLGWSVPALAHDGSTGPDAKVSIRDVGFDAHLGAQVPLDLAFHDESGRPVTLRDYMGARPVILTLNYYDCQNLCPLILQGLADTMVQVPFKLGSDYTAITVSIDPTSTAEDASDMKAELVHRYSRTADPVASGGWHFLTGDESQIEALASSVGFRYAYDPVQKDYAHPAGVMLLTPDGQIARYLYGMDFPANDLRLGLVEASQRKISTPIDAVLLLCYHYNPTTGRYSATALGAVRAGGALTVLALGAFLTTMWRREFRQARERSRAARSDEDHP